jgi:hypothetical protein
MSRVDDVARGLNTVGLAAWFGGSLMGAVALRGAGASEGRSPDALEVENDAWRAWSPVQTVAIGAHLLGSAKLATTNKGRVFGQQGVASVSIVKTACTLGAVGATWYASRLGRQVHERAAAAAARDREDHGPGAVRSGTADRTAEEALRADLQRLRLVQMAVPALTGAMLVADARLGEQQRPMQVLKGMAARAVPDALQSLPDSLPSLPDPLQLAPALGAVAGAAKSLPDAMRSLPESVQHLPDAARSLASR